jgi:hypothetical protein
VHKLTIGGPADKGMWFARSDEREGTFILSNPDLNAFKLPLMAMPSPSPAATVTASPVPSATPKP